MSDKDANVLAIALDLNPICFNSPAGILVKLIFIYKYNRK